MTLELCSVRPWTLSCAPCAREPFLLWWVNAEEQHAAWLVSASLCLWNNWETRPVCMYSIWLSVLTCGKSQKGGPLSRCQISQGRCAAAPHVYWLSIGFFIVPANEESFQCGVHWEPTHSVKQISSHSATSSGSPFLKCQQPALFSTSFTMTFLDASVSDSTHLSPCACHI